MGTGSSSGHGGLFDVAACVQQLYSKMLQSIVRARLRLLLKLIPVFKTIPGYMITSSGADTETERWKIQGENKKKPWKFNILHCITVMLEIEKATPQKGLGLKFLAVYRSKMFVL